ncbi:hydrolase in pqqF 5'region-like [Halichondria panicea]|uniref:hydrolase in pqqF 5'region-like n=1 Tax=Halichondria panicea TaxID=6063 RepID=UPI00312B349F
MATASTVLALFQGIATNKDVKANLSKMREQTIKAKEAGASIIVFPELFLTGYYLTAEEMRDVAQPNTGEAFQELSALAKETGVAILYGYPERVISEDGFKCYNSAQLIDKEGQSILNHRKVHLWIDDEGYRWEDVFTPAENFSEIVECCGFKIGVLICYDVEFPEAVRTLVLRGANLILVPTAVADQWIRPLVEHVIPARAYENRVHVAYVNNTGSRFDGKSVCCNENGETIASAGEGEEMVMATVTLSGAKSWHVRDRRPALYEK